MTARAAVAVAWLFGLAAVLAGGSGAIWSAGRLLFWLLLVVHAVECLVFLPALRRAPGSLGGHLLRTLLFGFLHYRELRGEEGGARAS